MVTPEKRQQIIELRNEGYSYSKIAELAGVARSTVYNVVQNEDDEEIDFEDYQPITTKFGDGLSGVELVELERTRLEGIRQINEQKFKLAEMSKEANHKREMELIKARQAEKDKEAERLAKEKKKEAREKAEKEFLKKKEDLHTQTIAFAQNYLDFDKENEIPFEDMEAAYQQGAKLIGELKKFLKEEGMTEKEAADNLHLSVLTLITNDYADYLDESDEDDEFNFKAELSIKIKIRALLATDSIAIDFE
jgi:predicted transcriptional regulator